MSAGDRRAEARRCETEAHRAHAWRCEGSYSSRRAVAGLTEVARHAGIVQASSATAPSIVATVPKVSGSCGGTPKRKRVMNLDANSDAAMPTRMPAATSERPYPARGVRCRRAPRRAPSARQTRACAGPRRTPPRRRARRRPARRPAGPGSMRTAPPCGPGRSPARRRARAPCSSRRRAPGQAPGP